MKYNRKKPKPTGTFAQVDLGLYNRWAAMMDDTAREAHQANLARYPVAFLELDQLIPKSNGYKSKDGNKSMPRHRWDTKRSTLKKRLRFGGTTDAFDKFLDFLRDSGCYLILPYSSWGENGRKMDGLRVIRLDHAGQGLLAEVRAAAAETGDGTILREFEQNVEELRNTPRDAKNVGNLMKQLSYVWGAYNRGVAAGKVAGKTKRDRKQPGDSSDGESQSLHGGPDSASADPAHTPPESEQPSDGEGSDEPGPPEELCSAGEQVQRDL